MGKIYDLTGCKFGKLNVIEKCNYVQQGNVMWKCVCDCGNETVVTTYNLRSGRISSCGCNNHRFDGKEDVSGWNNPRVRHNLRNTKLYGVWAMMKQRCSNPNFNGYKYYGGRGITVCTEWKKDFKIFYDWAITNGYADGLTIDRVDVDGNYEPENCRWVNRLVQQRNRRNCKKSV